MPVMYIMSWVLVFVLVALVLATFLVF